MADKNHILNTLQEVEESLAERVFADILSSKPEVQQVNTYFTKVGFFDPEADVLDRQIGKGVARGSITGVSTQGTRYTREGTKRLKPLVNRDRVSSILEGMASAKKGQVNLTIMPDRFRSSMLLHATGAAPTGGQNVIIGQKQLLDKFFGDVVFTNTGPESVTAQVSKAALSGKGEQSTGMSYLTRAYNMLRDGKTRLTEAQQLQMVFNAAFMRAAEAPSKSPYGMTFFKQTLANAGVQGLSTTGRTVFNVTDPNGIQRIAGAKPSFQSLAIYASHDTKVGGSSPHGAFMSRVRRTYGNKYAAKFGKLFRQMNKDAGNRLGWSMDTSGAIFVGPKGRWDQFVNIPGQYLDELFGSSIEGMPSGVVQSGGKLSFTKQIWKDGGIRSYGELAIDFFQEGLDQEGGLTPANIDAALQSASKNLTKRAEVSAGILLNETLEPLTLLGRPNIVQAISAQASLYVDANELKPYQTALHDLFGQARQSKKTSGGMAKLGDTFSQYVQELESKYTSPSGFFDKRFLTTVKNTVTQGNTVPTHLQKRFFLGMSTLQKRPLTKGVHQTHGMQEVVLDQEIRGIKAANAGVGVAYRASTVGMTHGDYLTQRVARRAYRPGSPLSVATGIKGSRHAVVNPQGMLAVVHTRGEIATLRMFGDSGGFLTEAGQAGYAQGQLPAQKVVRNFNQQGMEAYLRDLAGIHAEEEPWKRFLHRVRSSNARMIGMTAPDSPLPIAHGRRGAHQGATHFTGFKMSGNFDASRAEIFMSGRTVASHVSVLLGRETRVTARRAPVGFLKKQYGSIVEGAHIVIGGDTGATLNPTNKMFYHRTGMLQLKPGGAGERSTAGLHKAEKEFLRRYQKSGGLGLELKPDGTIIHTDAFNTQNFKVHSGRALKGMGYSGRQITGKFFSKVLPGGRMMPGMAQLAWLDETPGELDRFVAEKSELLFHSITNRFSQFSDITGQGSSFKVRLESLGQLSQGILGMYGSPAGTHPGFALMADALEQKRGVIVDSSMTRNVGVNDFFKQAPQSVLAPFAPAGHREALPKWAASQDIDILSKDEMLKRFGDVHLGTFGRDGLDFEELMKKNILDPEQNKGFFVKAEATVAAVSKEYGGDKTTMTLGYHYIPSAQKLRAALQGATGTAVSPITDTAGEAVFGLLQALRYGDGERPSGVQDVEHWLSKLNQGYASWGGREGKLKKDLLAARIGMSAKGRIVSTPTSVRDAYVGAGITSKGRVAASEFDVGISRGTLHQMVVDNTKGDKAKLTQEYKRILKKLQKGEDVFGVIQPAPTHGIGHLPIVRFKLDDALANDGVHKNAMAIKDYLNWTINRDVDMDNIEALLFEGPNLARLEKLSKRQVAMAWVRAAFKKQRLVHSTQYAARLKSAERGAAKMVSYRNSVYDYSTGTIDKQEFAKQASKFLEFGNAPPLGFMGEYANMSFASTIGSSASQDDIAATLNRVAGNRAGVFSKADVGMYQKAMQYGEMGADEVWSHAAVLERNIFQAPITKAGELTESMLTNIRDIKEQIDVDKSLAENVEMGIARSRQFFRDLVGNPEGLADVQKLGKMHLDAGIPYRNMSMDQIVETAANITGRVQAVTGYAEATHDASFSHPVHEALSGGRGALANIARMLFGVNVSAEVTGSVQDANEAAGLARDLPEASSEVLDMGKQFFLKHWRGIGVAAGLLVGARALSDISTPNTINMPPPTQAPLPPEPMVGMQPSGPQNFPAQQNAYLMPSDGQYGHSALRNNGSSVNISDARAQMGALMPVVGNSYANITVRDDRRHSNAWEMQRINSMANNSDFVHPYQDMA
jgi:hypothetical protein